MSLLHDGAFMAQFEQSKVEVKQQMNIMIEGIYAKVLLNLVQWLNKDNRNVENINNSSAHKLTTNHNAETEMELTIPNCPMSMHENVNRPLSPPSPPLPDHPQSHSTVLSIKSEIDSDCEQNITDNNNLPSEASDLQSIPSNTVKSLTSAAFKQAPHSFKRRRKKHCRRYEKPVFRPKFSDEINKRRGACLRFYGNYSIEIVSHNEVEVDYRDEIQYDSNDQQSISANDREYLFPNNEICDNVEFPNEESNELLESHDYSEVPNELSQNALTQQPSSEINENQMHFEKDDYDQELLDEVKREIKEEEELKRRENESKDGDMQPNEEDEQMESEQIEVTQAISEPNDQCNNNSDESMIIQQAESNTTSEIEENIANESTIIIHPIQQPNLAQTNVVESNHPLKFDPCPESYNHKYLFMKHNRQNIDRTFEHEQTMHPHDDSLLCVDCGQEFSRKLILKAHRRVHCRPY